MKRRITIYKFTWKDEDTNRVYTKKFKSEYGFRGDGVDHAALQDALEYAQAADATMSPWVIDCDGHEVASAWGGSQLDEGRLFDVLCHGGGAWHR
jgi:hypothetical protein